MNPADVLQLLIDKLEKPYGKDSTAFEKFEA